MSRQDQGTQKLVIPAGVGFDVSDDGVSIEHDGDVIISGPLRRPLARVTSNEGNITLNGELEVGEVIARAGSVVVDGKIRIREVTSQGGTVTLNGQVDAAKVRSPAGSIALHGDLKVGEVVAAEDISIEGDVEANLLRGGFVRVASGSLNAKGIEGTVRVELGEVRLGVEVIIAPDVTVDAATTGRVNVVESHNELGPNGLKGGFRLSEYAEFTGVDPQRFLAERGVRALEDLQGPAVVARGPVAVAADPGPEQVEAVDLEPVEPIQEVEPEEIEPVAEEELDEVELVRSVEIEDDEPESVEPDAPVLPPGLAEKLDDTVGRIEACYKNSEVPPAVTLLRELVDGGEYARIRDEITAIWNSLLTFHQKNNMRIQHQVTTTFNTLNSLVRKI